MLFIRSLFCVFVSIVCLGFLQACGGGGGSSNQATIVAAQTIDVNDTSTHLFLSIGDIYSATLKRLIDLGPHGGVPGKRFLISPDRQHIAYWKLQAGGSVQFQVARIDGSEPFAISSENTFPREQVYQWSPTGDQLLYTNAYLGRGARLLNAPAWSGIDLTQQGQSLIAYDWPSSSDRFFFALYDPQDQYGRICMYQKSTGTITTLHSAQQMSINTLSTSDDSSYLMASVSIQGEDSLLVIQTDTSRLRVFPNVFPEQWAWQKSSHRAFFIDGYTSQLKVIDAELTDVRDIANNNTVLLAHELLPSNTGTLLLFATHNLLENQYGLVRVSDNRLIYVKSFDPALTDMNSFVWSPDDRYFAAVKHRLNGGSSVLTVDVQSGEVADADLPEGVSPIKNSIVWTGYRTWAIRTNYHFVESRIYTYALGDASLVEIEHGSPRFPDAFEFDIKASVKTRSLMYLTAGPVAGEQPKFEDVGLLVRHDDLTHSEQVRRAEDQTSINANYFDVIE